MKGKIDTFGTLKIERAGNMITQICPHVYGMAAHLGVEEVTCGHHCPQFGEPEDKSPSVITLELCHGKKLSFTTLEDQR